MTYKILQDDLSLIILEDVGSTYRKLKKVSDSFVVEEYSIPKKIMLNSQKFNSLNDATLNFEASIQSSIKAFF
jgi:hypothetical protein